MAGRGCLTLHLEQHKEQRKEQSERHSRDKGVSVCATQPRLLLEMQCRLCCLHLCPTAITNRG